MSISPSASSLRGFMVLLLATLAGEALHRGLAIPVSGPVLGILLLVTGFALRRGVPPSLDAAGAPLLRHLSVLFVPAGVGLMKQIHLLGAHWPAIAVALVGSSVLCLLATAFSLRGLENWRRCGVQGEAA